MNFRKLRTAKASKLIGLYEPDNKGSLPVEIYSLKRVFFSKNVVCRYFLFFMPANVKKNIISKKVELGGDRNEMEYAV
jgi:hypothetical protein